MFSREELMGFVARGYCTPINSEKVLDVDLVESIAESVLAALKDEESPEPTANIRYATAQSVISEYNTVNPGGGIRALGSWLLLRLNGE